MNRPAPDGPHEAATVLWAVPVSDLGGVARHTLDVASHGIPGWRVVLLAPPGPLAERCQDLGVSVVAAAFGPDHGTMRSVRSLRSAIADHRPAIVHSHLAFADIAAALATAPPALAGRRPPALVSTEHGIAADDLVHHGSRGKARRMAAVHTARLRRTHTVIGVSRATVEQVRAKWHPGRRTALVVIRNGVDADLGPGSRVAPTPGLRVGAVARLAEEKGHLDLLDAFALVARDHPDATLRIAGTGPQEAQLRARIDALGLGGSVTLCGFQEPGPFLASTDVVVQLSTWENCSYTLLDALAAGLGVVATSVGGNAELLPERCLVPVGDAWAAADRIVAQGTRPAARPVLAPGWPTVAGMCSEIATHYDRVVRSGGRR